MWSENQRNHFGGLQVLHHKHPVEEKKGKKPAFVKHLVSYTFANVINDSSLHKKVESKFAGVRAQHQTESHLYKVLDLVKTSHFGKKICKNENCANKKQHGANKSSVALQVAYCEQILLRGVKIFVNAQILYDLRNSLCHLIVFGLCTLRYKFTKIIISNVSLI